MKKNTLKAFTLVEMLIVIVIIGILIAALMPRMQAAQGRARDVSRKTALSQVQSAIVTSQGDKGERPGKCEDGVSTNCASYGLGLNSIKDELTRAGMNSVPVDPLKTTELVGLGEFGGNTTGDYAYIVIQRNGTEDGGFVLMAKTEVEGGSNWIVDSSATTTECTSATDPKQKGCINKNMDITNIHPCTSFSKDETDETKFEIGDDGKCTYGSDDMLRYIVLY